MAALKLFTSACTLGAAMASSGTRTSCWNPVPHEIRVVTTTAASTLGKRGTKRLSPYMMAKASAPIRKVGQWVWWTAALQTAMMVS